MEQAAQRATDVHHNLPFFRCKPQHFCIVDDVGLKCLCARLHDEQITSHKDKVEEKHSEYLAAKADVKEFEEKLKKLETELDTYIIIFCFDLIADHTHFVILFMCCDCFYRSIMRLSKTTDACNSEREEKECLKKQIDTLTEISSAHESLKAFEST